MANMKFSLFVLYTTAGTLIWNIVLVCAGAILGESWETILDFMDIYSHIAYTILGLALVIFISLLFLRRRRKAKTS
jgi:LPXTG-motif cell wall-anchored protein